MTFLWPWAFAGLLLLPLLWWGALRELQLKVPYSDIRLLGSGRSALFFWLPYILRSAAVALMVVAAARPLVFDEAHKSESEGIDIMVALDTSGSMKALDLRWKGEQVDRLQVVKNVFQDFISARGSDRIGVVVFGSQAFTQIPLTLDHKMVETLVERIHIGMAGDATAIGDALMISIKRLQDLDAKSRIVILLTDGTSNAGTVQPLDAARVAQDLGIKVYTIGVGSHGKAPIPVPGFFGETIQYMEVEIDEDAMRKISDMTGGQYFRAESSETLEQVYKTIDQLEKRAIEGHDLQQGREYYHPWLGASLVLLFLELCWMASLMRRIPL